MATREVEFQLVTGLKRRVFRNARLRGGRNPEGRHSEDRSETPMREALGCSQVIDPDVVRRGFDSARLPNEAQWLGLPGLRDSA